jgi:protein-disulfide isomerase
LPINGRQSKQLEALMKYVLVLLMGVFASSCAAAATNDDALIERLEASGKLDAAVDRAIERRIARERTRREAAEKAELDAQKEVAKKVRTLDQRDRIYGAQNAKISIIVWSDPECPYCKQFAGTPQKAVDSSDGLANSAVRLLPLPFHGKLAIQVSATALCVADQTGAAGYYRFFDGYLAATQGNGKGLPDGKGDKSPQAVMASLIRQSGVTDTKKLKSCQESSDAMKRVRFEYDEAGEVGVQGTPTTILRNNESGAVELVAGAVSEESLLEKVRSLAAAK